MNIPVPVIILIISFLFFHASSAVTPRTSPTIDSQTLKNLIQYTKYASAAYNKNLTECQTIQGSEVIMTFNNELTDTQGYIARDDVNSQFIVAFRGSSDLHDAITDITLIPLPHLPLLFPLTPSCPLCLVHAGFFSAFSSVGFPVVRALKDAYTTPQYKNYTIVVTGHSLGGALVSMAAPVIKAELQRPTTAYTFGQPRVGDPIYAGWVNSQIGEGNFFRGTHLNDSVPDLLPSGSVRIILPLGGTVVTPYLYQHHSTEYWQHSSETNTSNVVKCNPYEDQSCNLITQPLLPLSIDAAHSTYFGVVMQSIKCSS